MSRRHRPPRPGVPRRRARRGPGRRPGRPISSTALAVAITSASVRAQKATSAPSAANRLDAGPADALGPAGHQHPPTLQLQIHRRPPPAHAADASQVRPADEAAAPRAPMATHEIRIDRRLPLAAEPHTGHNRWHPDIPPALRCRPGDEVVLETRDTFDGHFDSRARPGRTSRQADFGLVHPLTGPVYVDGAEPGRPPGGRDPRGDPRAVRVHRPGPGVRLPARRLPRAVPGAVGAGRRLGDVRRPARRAHRRRAVHGRHRRRPVPGAAGRRHGPGGGAGRPAPRRPRPAARPRRGGARRPGHRRRGAADRSRPGSTAATSTSSS